MISTEAACKWRSIAGALAAFIVTAQPSLADSTFEVPPLPLPGPYAVACSDVAQDFARVGPSEDASTYWEGSASLQGGRYITDLLAEPANTIAVSVTAPQDTSLFGSFAARAVPYVVIVCYPTPSGNPRPDYALPTGKNVPHMQRGSE